MAIANALHILSTRYDLSKFKLVLYCDNASALNEPKDPQKKQYTNPNKIAGYNIKVGRLKWYKKYIGVHLDKFVSVDRRLVKGHLPMHQWDNGNKGSYLNRWCDKECKRLKRKELLRRAKQDAS